MQRCIPLDAAAEIVCEQSSVCPLIFQIPPAQGRALLEKNQSSPVYLYPAEVLAVKTDTGKWGEIPLYFVWPSGKEPIRRVMFYIHGAGWVFGSFHTHEKLVRELAARTNSLIVFPEYSRSPEAKFPTAVEQCFSVFSRLDEIIREYFPALRAKELIAAGDSVGGNMAIAMCLMREMRKCPSPQKLLLYYPVTNACFNTPSYREFAQDYYLYREGMEWFWQQYAPCAADRCNPLASPLCADIKSLRCFPPTMIINGQADVLRSEGEAFGEKLRCAGVSVTALIVQGTIHDFVMLNALDRTNACRVAMDASVGFCSTAPL